MLLYVTAMESRLPQPAVPSPSFRPPCSEAECGTDPDVKIFLMGRVCWRDTVVSTLHVFSHASFNPAIKHTAQPQETKKSATKHTFYFIPKHVPCCWLSAGLPEAAHCGVRPLQAQGKRRTYTRTLPFDCCLQHCIRKHISSNTVAGLLMFRFPNPFKTVAM